MKFLTCCLLVFCLLCTLASFSEAKGKKSTYVRSYTRKDGTRVSGHWRSSSGSGSSSRSSSWRGSGSWRSSGSRKSHKSRVNGPGFSEPDDIFEDDEDFVPPLWIEGKQSGHIDNKGNLWSNDGRLINAGQATNPASALSATRATPVYVPPYEPYLSVDLDPTYAAMEQTARAKSRPQKSRSTNPAKAKTVSTSKQAAVTLPQNFSGKCVAVTDGDTLILQVAGRRVDVQLYGIDTPELSQEFGSQAKAFTSQSALGKEVTVYGKGTDGAGHRLAWAFVGKDCLNKMLLTNGLARFDRASAASDVKLSELEAVAKRNHSGLWAQSSPVAP